jgi:hypothetical protein
VASQLRKWDTYSGEIGDVEKTLLSAASNGHDAAEGGAISKKWKKFSNET